MNLNVSGPYTLVESTRMPGTTHEVTPDLLAEYPAISEYSIISASVDPELMSCIVEARKLSQSDVDTITADPKYTVIP